VEIRWRWRKGFFQVELQDARYVLVRRWATTFVPEWDEQYHQQQTGGGLVVSYYKAIGPEALARAGGRLAILDEICKVGRGRMPVVRGGRQSLCGYVVE